MDSGRIRDEIRRRYASVAANPEGQFAYPTGRASAERLGYRKDFMERIPPEVIRHFVGVGNPFSLGEPDAGLRVVDVGCGGGFDAWIAAQYVGYGGRVIGVDMSPEMLAEARAGMSERSLSNVRLLAGCAEALPLQSNWADLVLSNGVLNLTACKRSAFSEIARVLRPGGRFQGADLVRVGEMPEDLRNDPSAWST